MPSWDIVEEPRYDGTSRWIVLERHPDGDEVVSTWDTEEAAREALARLPEGGVAGDTPEPPG